MSAVFAGFVGLLVLAWALRYDTSTQTFSLQSGRAFGTGSGIRFDYTVKYDHWTGTTCNEVPELWARSGMVGNLCE
jgi:hypothetical protein